MKKIMILALAALLALPPHAASAKPAPVNRAASSADSAYPQPDKTMRVPVEGGSVYVRVNGNLAGPKPPVVFIHGGPGGTFDAYLEALPLAKDRAVILYDQLDTGYSDRPMNPANWRVARFVDELEAIRKALGISRWHVAGGSWGGTLALEYGARRLPSTASVTIMSPLVSTRSWIADADRLRTYLPAETQAALTSCEGATPPPQPFCEAATAAYYKRYVRRSEATSRQSARRKERGDKGGNAALYRAMWGTSEFSASGTLKTYNGEPLLAKLDGARTLFVTGQFDEATPETVGGFARRVNGAEFAVIPGAAHSLLGDRPTLTLAILRDFLARMDPKP